MAERNPVVLIHGYSDQAASFKPWKQALIREGYKEEEVHVCEYKSLTNEVTIKDVAEGFDRALRTRHGIHPDKPFDAIVHSTGMLVLRSWLSTYPGRRGRLKRLIALAPATFGSPLAHKGRGFLGAMFKGNRIPGPDFMEAGDLILDGLELGSRFTWDLTHIDVLGQNPDRKPYFGKGPDSPWVFILCGTESYGGLRGLVNEPGTDGTVRWAGCALNTQKITIDLARDGAARRPDDAKRFDSSEIVADSTLPMPVWLIAGRDHTTILSTPEGAALNLVLSALRVKDEDGFTGWQQEAEAATKDTMGSAPQWQQFVVRAVDERRDPISDWYMELFETAPDGTSTRVDFDLNVHAYRADPSLRCFHVNLTDLGGLWPDGNIPPLKVRVIASSGSDLVGYHGLGSERITPDGVKMTRDGVWDAEVSLPETFGDARARLFWPFTTTFLELRLNRDPMPFGEDKNRVCYFV